MAIYPIQPTPLPVSIYVRLKDGKLSVDPWICDIDPGKHQIIWLIDDATLTFSFDARPIIFNGSHPFKKIGLVTPWFATCVDNNQNATGKDREYSYTVNTNAFSFPIRCPPIWKRKARGGKFRAGPYIRNKPR